MSWFQKEAGFKTNTKIRNRLADRLELVTLLVAGGTREELARVLAPLLALNLVDNLYCWVCDHEADGVLARRTDSEIEAAAEWWGPPGRFVAALRSEGFLDDGEDGPELHDWKEHAYCWKKAKKEQARRRAKKLGLSLAQYEARQDADEQRRRQDAARAELATLELERQLAVARAVSQLPTAAQPLPISARAHIPTVSATVEDAERAELATLELERQLAAPARIPTVSATVDHASATVDHASATVDHASATVDHASTSTDASVVPPRLGQTDQPIDKKKKKRAGRALFHSILGHQQLVLDLRLPTLERLLEANLRLIEGGRQSAPPGLPVPELASPELASPKRARNAAELAGQRARQEAAAGHERRSQIWEQMQVLARRCAGRVSQESLEQWVSDIDARFAELSTPAIARALTEVANKQRESSFDRPDWPELAAELNRQKIAQPKPIPIPQDREKSVAAMRDALAALPAPLAKAIGL